MGVPRRRRGRQLDIPSSARGVAAAAADPFAPREGGASAAPPPRREGEPGRDRRFARLGGPPATVDGLVYNGFFFSACGAGCGLASMAWTWRCARLARLEPADASAPALDAVLRRTRGALRAGVKLNLAGMALTLLSAEQVVGTLLAKALAAGPVWGLGAPGAGSAAAVQAFTAIDLYVIQANTNSLAAHFVSLLAGLALLARSDKW